MTASSPRYHAFMSQTIQKVSNRKNSSYQRPEPIPSHRHMEENYEINLYSQEQKESLVSDKLQAGMRWCSATRKKTGQTLIIGSKMKRGSKHNPAYCQHNVARTVLPLLISVPLYTLWMLLGNIWCCSEGARDFIFKYRMLQKWLNEKWRRFHTHTLKNKKLKKQLRERNSITSGFR